MNKHWGVALLFCLGLCLVGNDAFAATSIITNITSAAENVTQKAQSISVEMSVRIENLTSGKIGVLGDLNIAGKLQEKMSRLQGVMDKGKAAMDKLQAKVDVAKDKFNTLQEQKDNMLAKAKSITDEYNKAKEKLNEVKTQVNSAKEKFDDIKKQVNDGIDQVNGLKDQVTTGLQQVNGLKEQALGTKDMLAGKLGEVKDGLNQKRNDLLGGETTPAATPDTVSPEATVVGTTQATPQSGGKTIETSGDIVTIAPMSADANVTVTPSSVPQPKTRTINGESLPAGLETLSEQDIQQGLTKTGQPLPKRVAKSMIGKDSAEAGEQTEEGATEEASEAADAATTEEEGKEGTEEDRPDLINQADVLSTLNTIMEEAAVTTKVDAPVFVPDNLTLPTTELKSSDILQRAKTIKLNAPEKQEQPSKLNLKEQLKGLDTAPKKELTPTKAFSAPKGMTKAQQPIAKFKPANTARVSFEQKQALQPAKLKGERDVR